MSPYSLLFSTFSNVPLFLPVFFYAFLLTCFSSLSSFLLYLFPDILPSFAISIIRIYYHTFCGGSPQNSVKLLKIKQNSRSDSLKLCWGEPSTASWVLRVPFGCMNKRVGMSLEAASRTEFVPVYELPL